MNSSKLADSNIPQGRGMVKWAPFATMPEQYENIDNILEAQNYVPKPILNDELQQELELKLRELIGQNVILRYWQDGHEFIIECTLADVDDWSEHVTAVKDGNLIAVMFSHVYSVDEYRGLDVV